MPLMSVLLASRTGHQLLELCSGGFGFGWEKVRASHQRLRVLKMPSETCSKAVDGKCSGASHRLVACLLASASASCCEGCAAVRQTRSCCSSLAIAHHPCPLLSASTLPGVGCWMDTHCEVFPNRLNHAGPRRATNLRLFCRIKGALNCRASKMSACWDGSYFRSRQERP